MHSLQTKMQKLTKNRKQVQPLSLTSEHTSSEDNSERKFQADIYPSNKCFEQQEE